MSEQGVWRFQSIDGRIRVASPTDGKYDVDLLEEHLNATGDDFESVEARYIKVQYQVRDTVLHVSLLFFGADIAEVDAHAAFEDWAHESGMTVNWGGATPL